MNKKTLNVVTVIFTMLFTINGTIYTYAADAKGYTLQNALEDADKSELITRQKEINTKKLENQLLYIKESAEDECIFDLEAESKAVLDYIKNFDWSDPDAPIDQERNGYTLKQRNFTLQKIYAKEAAERNGIAFKNNMEADVEKVYIQALIAQKKLDMSKQSMSNIENLYNLTKKKYDAGLIDKRQYLNAEVALSNSQKDVNVAEKQLNSIMMQLNLKTGNEITSIYRLNDQIEKVNSPDLDVNNAIQTAQEQRNEIKAAKFNVYKLNLVKKLADVVYLSNFDYKNKGLNYETSFLELEEQKRTVETEVRDKIMNISQKEQEIDQYSRLVDVYTDYYSITKGLYDELLCTISELSSAQDLLTQAQLSKFKAILEYNQAVRDFTVSVGIGKTEVPLF